MHFSHYIAQSKARTEARFGETRRLLAHWQDAFRLWLANSNPDTLATLNEAHTAYKTEQYRALSQPNPTNPAQVISQSSKQQKHEPV